MEKRVEWIDTAKFFGMFFIYLGHFGPDAGYAYPWVFSFHVALFFFLSGCLENYNRRGLLKNLWHKAVHTLLPFYLFGLLSIVYEIITENSLAVLPESLRILALGGVRNSIAFGGGLWFLSCLFVIQVIFSLLKKIRFKILILAICLGLFLVAEFIIDPRPVVSPHWYYNLDSAFYYLIFYFFGWFTYPLINHLLSSRQKPLQILKAVITIVCLIYSVILFFGKDLLAGVSALHPLLRSFCGLITPLFSIWLVVYFSYLLPGKLLKHIGSNSLYMCGNEFIIKSLIPLVLALIGLPLAINTPIQAYIYSFVLLFIVDKLFVPWEKPLLEKLQGTLTGSKK